MRRYVFWFLSIMAIGWSQTYDLAITGGRVLDPANLIDDVLNIAISNGQIVKVTRKPVNANQVIDCLLYTSPSPRDLSTSRMPSSA